MNIIRALVLGIGGIIFAVALVGTASAGELEGEKYELGAFSVVLPATSGWKNQSKPNELNLGRLLGNPLHTFTLSVRQYPLVPEPGASVSVVLASFRRAAEKEMQAKGRYQLTSHSENINIRSGLECVEYQKTWIDHGDSITQYKKLFMLGKGLVCIHPESACRLVEISYSSRNSSGGVSQEITAEGEAFINSLRARNLGQ